MRSRTLIFVFVVLGTRLMLAPLGAQYNPPGDLLAGDLLEDEAALRASLDDARWRWGVLRLDPWIGLDDVSYVTSTDAAGRSDDDVTATLGAGLRGYLKTGSSVIWAAHALPEYVWWQASDAKSGLHGRYGFGMFAFTNRLDFEASARRSERQGFFSPELQSLTTTRLDLARLAFELALSKRFYLTGVYRLETFENQEDETPVFGQLDRESETVRVVLRYRSPLGWWIGGGLEDGAVVFDDHARNLSNDQEASLLDLGYEAPRFALRFQLERRSLVPRDDSEFADLDLTTGLLETQWNVHRSVDAFFYGRRQLAYSINRASSDFVSSRYGARLDVLLRGPTLEIAAEIGDDDYEPIGPQAPHRVDDVTAVAMSLRFDLRRALKLRLGLTYTDYDSNLDVFDRDVTAWIAAVEVTALRERFRLGDGEKIW